VADTAQHHQAELAQASKAEWPTELTFPVAQVVTVIMAVGVRVED
jgi:hypothetical protein